MQGASLIPHHYYGFDYSLMSSSSDEEVAASNIFNTMLNYDNINSPVSVMMNSDRILLPQMSEIDMAAAYINQKQNIHVFEAGEVYNPMPQNWAEAIQGGKMALAAKVEEGDDQVKVGRYSVEERKDRILRYLQKRSRRNFNKTIKYACRKTLADKRVRVRGRFAKNSEAEPEPEPEPSQCTSQGEEDEEGEEASDEFIINRTGIGTGNSMAMACTSFHDEDQFSSSPSFQMIKYDEDDWFQAAIDNIGNLPYL